jgi:hypothetical protein
MIPIIKNPYWILFFFLFDISLVLFLLYHISSVFHCDCFTRKDASVKNTLMSVFVVEILIMVVYVLNFFQIWRLVVLNVGELRLFYDTQVVLAFFLFLMTVFYCVLYYFVSDLQKSRFNLRMFSN